MSYKPLPPFVTIRPSWIEGLGVFATHEIKKGTELGISHIEIDNELHRESISNHISSINKDLDFIYRYLDETDTTNIEEKNCCSKNCIIM